MKATHVCLISEQPIPNLVPLLHEKPARAVFLVSAEMKEKAARLVRILQPHGIKLEMCMISPYNFGEVAKICEKIIENTPGALVLNVTGGTKISAMAAFQSFYFSERACRIIYLHTAANSLLHLAPEEGSEVIGNLVSVKECLASYGLDMTNKGCLPANSEQRVPHLNDLCRLFVMNESLLARFNGAISQNTSQGRYANITLNTLGKHGDDLVLILEKSHVAARTGSGMLNISSAEKLFFCHGGWLEEYVFHAVRNLRIKGLKPLINVKVAWDGSGPRPTTNEFDVLFTNSNRLHLISCKTSDLDRQTAGSVKGKEALYELDSLSEAAGGLFGRAMLCSAKKLASHSLKRAEMLNIKVVDGAELFKLPEILRKWCGK